MMLVQLDPRLNVHHYFRSKEQNEALGSFAGNAMEGAAARGRGNKCVVIAVVSHHCVASHRMHAVLQKMLRAKHQQVAQAQAQLVTVRRWTCRMV